MMSFPCRASLGFLAHKNCVPEILEGTWNKNNHNYLHLSSTTPFTPPPKKWLHHATSIPVVPGQAGGGSFKEKNDKSKKEFAYRMRARRPTSAMPKPFLCCERAFCRSMVVMLCALKWSVLMSWCLLRGQVMWWSRHLMRCDGLCCVMSRDAMRCHGDELYYSRTTLCYKILIQILLCTTKYYSSTTLYYKVLLKYYSSTNLYYKVLLQY